MIVTQKVAVLPQHKEMIVTQKVAVFLFILVFQKLLYKSFYKKTLIKTKYFFVYKKYHGP